MNGFPFVINRRKFLQGSVFSTLLSTHPWAGEGGAKAVRDAGADGLSEFDNLAFAALPIEKPYDFANVLKEGFEWLRLDTGARPTPLEMALPAKGWTLLIPSHSGMVLRQAAEEFRVYLGKAMQTCIIIETRDSLAGWKGLEGTIIAGTRESLPGCGLQLKGPKDYQIIASPERIVVCGFDEKGAMYGLYNLEARMNLREAPFLPYDLNTIRYSLYKTRMTLSGLGWMEWPDRYLALLARYGFDSLFASVYCNPNGVGGPPPFWNEMRTQDPARVRDLIHRAARFGLDLYCPIVYRYTDEPENTAGLRKLVQDIVTTFPEIRGYILLTEGFFYKTWFGAGGQKGDLHEWIRGWAKGVSVVVEECQRINPNIEVLPWDYNIDFRPDQVEVKKFVIEQLPEGAIPLITFENGKSFSLDGESSYLKDYAINEPGPSEVAAAQIAAAKRRGMRAVYAKADTSASWQLGTFPYLPFPQQWYARYQALEDQGIDGVLESWSYGFQPSFIGEMRCWYSWSDAPPIDDLLHRIARRDFGPGSEALVLSAWNHFTQAIRILPETADRVCGCNAVAAPFFLEEPKPRMMTLKHSWTDEKKWESKSGINPAWPYTASEFIMFPDFTNRVNVAERHAQPLTLQVYKKYFLKAADEMARGLEGYRRAALMAPASKRKNAFREVLLAEQVERMMRSAEALLEFEDLRFHLADVESGIERERMLNRMAAILMEETVRAEAARETARRDSRLGYEWEEDYIYTPEIIERKLELLRITLTQQIPSLRRFS
jgi:hypothetical protein